MSGPPEIVTGDFGSVAEGATSDDVATTPGDRRAVHDLWLSGTEAPRELGSFTDEGAQEMLGEESDLILAGQRGTLIEDDYESSVDSGDDELQIINMGPQHPATHGVLRLHIELDGETIRRVKPIIGYLHTGMEKTAEVLSYMQGSTNVTRMDYLSPLHNELCFSLAVEKLLEVDVPPRAQAIRILMSELNRISSHLLWSATSGFDIGALSMMIYGLRERESVLEFFEKTTGLRMNHNFIRPGGVVADLPTGWREDVAAIIETVTSGLAEFETLLMDNPIFIERTQGIGILTRQECLAYGVTGPVARASGIDYDVRKVFPYSGFEHYDFEIPTTSNGDVYDRFVIRFEEIRQSMHILEQVMQMIPDGDYRIEDSKVTPPPRACIDESMEALIHHFKIFTEGFKVSPGETYQAVESSRGELGMYLVSDGGPKPWRLHVRGPSFAHVQALPMMLTDSLIADTVAALASADPVMGDVDR